MAKSEDDFWNTSSHSGFNFDDEDDVLSGQSLADNTVFRTLTAISSELPIHAVISKKSLDLILNDITSTLPSASPPVEEAIRKITLGLHCNLHAYIKFTDKIKLLQKALETCDANVIIKIILYLKSTLKKNIFYHQLAKQKSAVKNYGYYLLMRHQVAEMADLYMATGNSSNMKYLFYLTGQNTKNKSMLYRKLEQFMAEHIQRLNTNDDKQELRDNLHLLKFQMDFSFASTSVITQLAELCKREMASLNKGLEKLHEFQNTFKIDSFTFDWTLMNVLASMQLWMHINDIFIKSNWLTKKNVLKTSLPPEVLLNGLSRHKPPKDILETFLWCVSDNDKAFALAKSLQCHNFLIQYYVNQRDRMALLQYRQKVPHQSSEYFLIESSLQSTDKRWKN